MCNSLYSNGFRGEVYAGYRGKLPSWAVESQDDTMIDWHGAKVLKVREDFVIHFLPVELAYQFTNYKPIFIARLFGVVSNKIQFVAYFDPDIVIKCQWSFFEKWMSHGVALVHEITSNDMPPSNPVRKEWEKIICDHGLTVTRRVSSYINAGFCGVARDYLEFVEIWSKMIETAIKNFDIDPTNFNFLANRAHPFFAKDQDALNIAAMCSKSPISEIGPEGMDFIHGGFTMSHAIGTPKPWKKHFFLKILNGEIPSVTDRLYWLNASGTIKPHSEALIWVKKTSMSICSFIGRFYKKN